MAKRGLDGDDDDVVPPDTKRAKLSGPGRTGLLDLPDELLGEVSVLVAHDQSGMDVNSLVSLRQACSRINSVIKDSLPAYSAGIQLSHLSETLYSLAIPDGPLATEAVALSPSFSNNGADDDEESAAGEAGRPATAADRIAAIGPILAHQSDSRRSDLVGRILAIPTLQERAEAIAVTAPHIEAFSEADRSRLFGGVVDALAHVDYTDDPEHLAVWFASKSFLEMTWSHMSDIDHDKIYGDAESDQTGSIPTFNNRYVYNLIRMEHQSEPFMSQPSSPASTPGDALEKIGTRAPDRASPTVTVIAALSSQVRSLSDDVDRTCTRADAAHEDQNSRVAIERFGRVAERFPGAFRDARQALIEQTRERDRGR